MKSKFVFVISLFLFNSVALADTTYVYELQVNEIVALQHAGVGTTFVLPEDQIVSKSYTCELTVEVKSPSKSFRGSWGDGYGARHEWQLLPTKELYKSVRCPGAERHRLDTDISSTSYYRGSYQEQYSYNGTPSGAPEKSESQCTTGELQRVAISTPNNGNRLIKWPCADFDPNAEQSFGGRIVAHFVMPIPEDKNDVWAGGKTSTLLKLKDGKISGYSDELSFSGTYKLKQ